MKKKSVLILVALCLVVSMFALVACNDDKAPEKKEGVLYQSDVESFWVGIGKAYMTLEHITEPETPRRRQTLRQRIQRNSQRGQRKNVCALAFWHVVD